MNKTQTDRSCRSSLRTFSRLVGLIARRLAEQVGLHSVVSFDHFGLLLRRLLGSLLRSRRCVLLMVAAAEYVQVAGLVSLVVEGLLVCVVRLVGCGRGCLIHKAEYVVRTTAWWI